MSIRLDLIFYGCTQLFFYFKTGYINGSLHIFSNRLVLRQLLCTPMHFLVSLLFVVGWWLLRFAAATANVAAAVAVVDRQTIKLFLYQCIFGKISSIQPRFISIKLNLFVFVLRIYSIQAFFFLSCFFVNHSFAIIYFHLSYFLRVHFIYSTKKKTDGQIRFGNRKRPHKPLLLLLLPPRRATVLLYYCWLFGSIYTFFFFCIYSSFLQFLLISCCCFSPLDFT